MRKSLYLCTRKSTFKSMKTTTPRPVLLAFVAAVFLFLSPLRAQMIIDTWSFATGVDTTLWMDLGAEQQQKDVIHEYMTRSIRNGLHMAPGKENDTINIQ